jgi:hypothetical protein
LRQRWQRPWPLRMKEIDVVMAQLDEVRSARTMH